MRRFCALSGVLAVMITATVLVANPDASSESSTVQAVAGAPAYFVLADELTPAPSTTTTTVLDLGPPCAHDGALLAIDPACVPPTTTTAAPRPRKVAAAPELPPEPTLPPTPELPHEPPSGDAVWEHLASIRQCESGSNYGAVSSSGKYRGAYQFASSTWRTSVAGAGYDTAAYPLANEAPPEVQDAAAYWLYTNATVSRQWPVCSRR